MDVSDGRGLLLALAAFAPPGAVPAAALDAAETIARGGGGSPCRTRAERLVTVRCKLPPHATVVIPMWSFPLAG